MASTVGPSPPSDSRLSIESLPTVDLRLLSQSELTALSLCSSHSFDLRRCDDVVIPKIDRSVFNESAGSRKQTYSRLRLAPRNTNHHLSTSTTTTPKPPRPSLDSDNSRIISLFKSLFNNLETTESNLSSALVPVNIEYSDALLCGVGKRKRGRKPREDNDVMTATTAVTTVAVYVEKEREMEKEEEKEKEREIEIEMEKEKKEKQEKELVNRHGEVVDLRELGKKDDPYGVEIRKRTEGKESPEELLGFISDLDGQWGSRRKKRKIVDANVFGDFLPNGWKILIAMKKKQGRAWLFCRRYIRFLPSLPSFLSFFLSFFFVFHSLIALDCFACCDCILLV